MNQPLSTIADHMKVDLVTLTTDMEIVQAVSVLLGNNVSGACVLDAAGVLVGVLSKRDCLKAALNASYITSSGAERSSITCRPIPRPSTPRST